MSTFLEYRRRIHAIAPESTQIEEELLPKEVEAAEKMRENGHAWYRQKFLEGHPGAKQLFGGTQSGRIPVSMSESSSKPHSGVTDFIREHGYDVTPENYRAGIATKTVTTGDASRGIVSRTKTVEHKIGGLLEKHNAGEDIKKSYVNDTFRNGAKTTNAELRIDGSARGAYECSTGQGWTSCAQMRKGEEGYGGPAGKFIAGEINNHTHNVYLEPIGGGAPTGRLSFKHHTGLLTGHETLIPETTVYGQPPPAFADVVKREMSKLFKIDPNEVYKKNPNVYNDNHVSFKFPEHVKPEHLDVAMKSLTKKESDSRFSLYNHVNPEHKYKSRELNSVAKGIKQVKDAAAIGDFVKSTEAINTVGHIIHKEGQDSITYSNPHYIDAMHHSAAAFDINKPEHVRALLANQGNRMSLYHAREVTQRIPPAKTIDQYHAHEDFIDRGLLPSGNRYKINIAHDHSLGKKPIDTIVKSLADRGSLDVDSYMRAYHSTSGHPGNLYDMMHHHEKMGIPGMSGVLNDAAKKLERQNIYGNRDANMAVSYSTMKPATRARVADALGHNHVKLMRDHRGEINDLRHNLAKKPDNETVR